MNRYRAVPIVAWAAVGLSGFCCTKYMPPANAGSELQRVDRDQMCVTNGVIIRRQGSRLSIETPSSRAVVPGAAAQIAEIHFQYLGPSESSKPLASGELRRQIGLKLKAQDTCNLLYAMWHIEPDNGLAVSIKRNPGMHTHAKCGARGYVAVKPEKTRKLAKPEPREFHRLRAALHGDRLTLVADGQLAWEGSVGALVTEFDGPVGLRTDNARFDLEYLTVLSDPAPPKRMLNCAVSPGD